MKDIRTTLVVGAGTMGHGFAQIFALNRVPVRLVDETDELLKRARGWIIDNLNTMVELGEIERVRMELALGEIYFTTDLKQAAQEVDFVLEAVFENLDLKKRIFQQLDMHTRPHAILASNTSSFDINELSAVTVHPERVIGTHWYHPPQITPCVEVIPSKATEQQTIQRTMGFMARIGKVPTLCKSAPGFVGNRIQFAMAAEACAIVEEGLATPEEVDQIVITSFGFRLGVYGPFQICDQAGLDTYHAVYEYLYDKLKKEQFKPPGVLRMLMKQGRYGLKTQKGFYEYKGGADEATKRERDRKLYARLRLFREEQKAV
jgi:3-hydroxybutyryl-CoA dehydrogenase